MADEVYELAKERKDSSSPKAFHEELHNATILLMRHAEKPDAPGDRDLSPEGLARAQALATYIPEHFGRKPDYLFAAADSANSARPRETLEPLSKMIGVPIDSSIDDKNYKQLANKLDDPQFDGKLVVIAWHHGKIPQLAASLGAPEGSYPNPWDGNVFNHIIELDYDENGIPKVKDITEDINIADNKRK